MKRFSFAVVLAVGALALGPKPEARAQRRNGGQIAGGILNAIGQGLGGGGGRSGGYRNSGGRSGGYPNSGGRSGGNRNSGSGGNWFTQTPKYRYEQQYKDPFTNRWLTADEYRNTDIGETDRRRVKVKDGYETKVNILGIVEDGIKVLGSERGPHPQERDRRRDSGYTNSGYSPTYSPPASSYQAPTNNLSQTPRELTRNELVDAVDAVEPTENEPVAFFLDDEGDLEDAADTADKQANEKAEKIKEDQHKKTKEDAEDLVGKDPNEKEKEFLDAVDKAQEDPTDENIKKMKEAGEAAGIKNDDGKLDDLGKEIEKGKALGELDEMVQDGASADEIEEFISDSGLEDDGDLEKPLEDLKETVGIRDAIDSALDNQDDEQWPQGQTDIITVPDLDEGIVAVTEDGQIIQGTGGEGELGIHQGTVADVVGMPVPEEDPLADIEEDAAGANSGVVLRNPKKNRIAVHYRVNGHEYTMEPGYTQQLSAGQVWVVEFDRGGDFGTAEYSLSEGTYAFEMTSKGWDLYQQSYEVTIDNSENKHDFHYLVNGEEAVVRAKRKQQHTSEYPPVIAFDRGDGGEPGRKKLDSGVYQVGMDIENRRIELFPSDPSQQRRPAGPKKARSRRAKGRRGD